ncbi:reverse transcriptase domain-containing protein [Tanacetum coccineum]|uniref:Reverse transcriptase domain-containing protein n=1 Tax=Tanacetum coccineum TaxID=301880 RepID=A0ABQ5F5K4_9ASTR
MIEQGVTTTLVERDADKSMNGDDSYNSGTGVRRNERAARECTYPDFMKCQPQNFKGTEGVVELTQWTVGHDVAYAMTWEDLKKKMTNKYCPRTEIKKLEDKLWNLKVKESDKIKRYVDGLPDVIHGSVVASKPKTMQEAIEIASELIDKKIRTFSKCQTENKRKQDDNQQQQQNKRQNTGRAYTIGSGEKKPYGGSKPLCPKCNYHHDGPCAPKCHKCQKPTCYEYGTQGHFKRDCPKLKNNNHGNQGGNGNALVKVYAVGRVGTNPGSNVVTGTFLLNNCYASVLFDTGADRSFVSTAFSSQIDITPSTLDHLKQYKFENSFKSLDKRIECHIVNNCKKGLGYEKYNAIPPPYTGNFMPPTPDYSFTGLDVFVNEHVVENSKAMSSEEEPKVVRKNNNSLIIEEWVSNSEEENVSQTKTEKKTVKPSIAKIKFVKPKQQEKSARKTAKQVEKHRQNNYSPRGNQRN